MKIKLTGDIHHELKGLDLKAGDEINNAELDPISKVGCVHFSIMRSGSTINCSVWPENYEIIPAINNIIHD